MEQKEFYKLPTLPYDLNALEPHISEEQLKVHYSKHHQRYVDDANELLRKLDKAREENSEPDMRSIAKALSFNVGGIALHNLFWEVLSPEGGGEPQGMAKDAIEKKFGSFERFKKEFTRIASEVEGGGWAALTYCKQTNRAMIMQIEKHNVNVMPGYKIFMAIDVWEHAYYLDYKSERSKYLEGVWNIINWKKIEENFTEFIS